MPDAIPLHSLPPAQLWDVLDLERPGLEAVRRAVQAGQIEQALTELLAHYRRRFPLPDPAPAASAEIIQDADEVTQFKLKYLGYPAMQYSLPADWEWDPHDDIEWVAGMYRFCWSRPLATAYAATRDDRYPRAFVQLASDWIAQHPLEKHERTHRTLTHWKGFAWLDIQTGIRASALCYAFPLLVHGESFTPEFLGILLASFYDHQVKSELIPMTVYHNKALMELNGYAQIAAMLPEFRDTRHWLEVAQARLWDKLQGQVTSDGVQREWSFGYHCHVLSDAVSIWQILEKAGLPIEPQLRERLWLMYEFLYGFASPELATAMFGDTRREPADEVSRSQRMLYSALQQGAALFNELKWKALAELDLAHLPPAQSYAWPEAGLYALRNGWDADQIYFPFHDSPPAASSHDQEDNGTFELYAYGRWLMTDSGYYTYGHDKEARAWHRQTSVHQTITLNGKNSRTLGTQRLWTSQPSFDTIVADNAAYPGLLHRRAVWFVDRRFFAILDEAIGDAQGTLDLHYQFARGMANLDSAGHRAYTRFPDANVLVWMPNDAPVKIEEEEGWSGWDYNKRARRTAFRFRFQGAGAPARFLTLLIPYRGPEAPAVEAQLPEGIAVGGDRIELAVGCGGERWQIGYDLASGQAWCNKVGA